MATKRALWLIGACTGPARRSSRRGDALLDLWVEHYDKLDEPGRQLLRIKPVHFLDVDAAGA
jgi:hypothetical protein